MEGISQNKSYLVNNEYVLHWNTFSCNTLLKWQRILAFHILTKAAPSCLNVSGTLGKPSNWLSQTCSIGDISGVRAGHGSMCTLSRCNNAVTTRATCSLE